MSMVFRGEPVTNQCSFRYTKGVVMPTENTPISIMSTHQTHISSIEVAGADLVFQAVSLADATPTGAQIAAAAGFNPAQQASVLLLLANGELEDIRPGEVVDLTQKTGRFIVVESDRSYRLTIDGKRIDWPCRLISGSVIRLLGQVQSDKVIYFERHEHADKLIKDDEIIDLDRSGVEAFYSRAGTWVLNVQGVRLEVGTPTIVVSEALTRAGFDVNQGWHIFLKVAGQPKQPLELTSVVDLRTPGIEKIRLTPKDVSNGETAQAVRRDFALLELDESFLDEHFAHWETVIENQRRWLLIYGYHVPQGYGTHRVTLALDVPPSYPGAQIDMFYVSPHLVLNSGQALACTEAQETINGITYQRWSRHRTTASEWRPDTDNVITHLALVESALAKEVQQ